MSDLQYSYELQDLWYSLSCDNHIEVQEEASSMLLLEAATFGVCLGMEMSIFLSSERILKVKFGVIFYNSTVGRSRNIVLVVLKQVLYLIIQDLSHEESKIVTFSERKIEEERKEETNIN